MGPAKSGIWREVFMALDRLSCWSEGTKLGGQNHLMLFLVVYRYRYIDIDRDREEIVWIASSACP